MSYQTQSVHTHSTEDSRPTPAGEAAVPTMGSATEHYVHPFELIPKVTQPDFDTRFTSILEQRVIRTDALFNLATLTITESGTTTPTTDRWLALARQNVRELDGKLGVYDEERASMVGLVATYLASDTTLRASDEADVYQIRVKKAEELAGNSYASWSPHRDAHLAIQRSLDNLKGLPEDLAAKALETLPANPESAEFTQAKARALFDYATTMQPTDEKRVLLLEAITYADETFARADGNDYILRASALHTLSRALHDASYIPRAFSDDDRTNEELAKQAQNFCVALLQESTLEFQRAYGHNITTPIDKSAPWKAQTELDQAYDDARYFVNLYGESVRSKQIYMPKTPEIEELITRLTAQKFGHTAISLTEHYLPASESEMAFAELK